MMRQSYQLYAEKIQIYLIIFACFSIALPTAFMSLSMGLLIIVWILSGNYRSKYNIIVNHPAAIVSILLFVLYGIGMLYSSASWEARIDWWLKYHKLLYIPVIIGVLTQEKFRRLALQAFLAGMLMILVISYLKWLGLVPHKDIGQGYFVFKGRIAHNIFLAFTVYLTLYLSVSSHGIQRWSWIAVSILVATNIFFLVNGRTGQILLFVLLFWFGWEIWGWRSIRWLAIMVIAAPVVYFMNNEIPGNRLVEIRQEILSHEPNQAPTSSGLRLEFYKNALSLFKKNPIFGSGTGSFENEYRRLAETQITVSTYVPNPHNEFLLIAQQLGVIGLSALAAFFVVPWILSKRLSSINETSDLYSYAMRGLIVTMVVGSLFNSLLLDAGEGKFYCVLAGVFLSVYPSTRDSVI